ncbi:hypothetical protein [Streptomyces ochraceiscleroticus]|uniref:Uncharacterized protein n=1 Tax=Streptomyces ochraceiscleroticus TaxID=47761 RepID=A0ABW1MJE5_9ACTN|nr:hypothetical protein [Streptomyces ochraceiscleroticus]
MDPSDQYVSVELSKSPDEIANVLFGSMLPDDPLARLDLRAATGERGLALFMAALVHRLPQRSLERDEIVAFVERNRATLQHEGWLEFLIDKLPAGRSNDEGAPLLDAIRDAAVQMRHALRGRPQDINVISNRLLYLCIALDMKLGDDGFTYETAVAYLRRSQTQALMSDAAVMFMFADYYRNMDEIDEPRTGHVMLLTECALLADANGALLMAKVLLRGLPPPVDTAAWLDVRRRLAARLRSSGSWTAEDESSLARAVGRFTDEVPDDDL